MRWRREVDNRRQNRQRLAFAAVLVAFVGLTGWLVWAFLWWQPPPETSLILLSAGYETNLTVPHNVFGREGVAALADLAANPPASFRNSVGMLKLRHEPFELDSDRAWDTGLEANKAKTVIVFLALHGGNDAEGPYLLRADAGLRGEKESRLRIAAVLKRLAGLPENTNKLLVLDATQVPADWERGMLHNDFARALTRLEPDIRAVPNLVVLSASAEDQRSWASEELRRTIFGHYLVEGLKGAADENGDGRISALELHRFVARSVEQWVRGNRLALQTPVLLPQGEVGERRARAMHLTLATQSPKTLEPPVPAGWTAPAELRLAWQRAAELAKQDPPPAAYTPQLWRQYLATLMRYEQLRRAGEEERASELFGRLTRLESSIRDAAHLELRCAENTLALPAFTTGMRPDPRGAGFDALWSAPAEERREKWTKPADQRASFRTAIAAGAIDRAAVDPTNNLGPAVALLKEMYVETRMADKPRPAESHFLAMLAARLARPVSPELASLTSLALRVRVEAEQAALGVPEKGYPYSEQIWPWIRPSIEEGDRLRQLGQDLLVAGDAERFTAARNDLQQAANRYREAQATAASVRAAIILRDRALAELPGYSHWLAAREQDDNNLLGEVEKLWRETFRLADTLAAGPGVTPSPPPPLPVKGENGADLDARTETLRKSFVALKARFMQQTRDLIDRETIAEWREAEAALNVPFLNGDLDADKRLLLIATCRTIERKMLQKGKSGAEAEAVGAESNRKLALERAQRQGRMALAALGRGWFDTPGDGAREDFERVANRLRLFSSEENWFDSLGKAGEQIGLRWQQLPTTANGLADEGQRADLPRARKALAESNRLVRILDGTRNADLTADPARLNRLLRTHDLLVAQARRTEADHWFAENDSPDVTPYYQAAARLFVDDAARQVSPSQAALDAKTLRAEIDRPGRLTLAPAAPVVLTSEKEGGIAYQLQGAAEAGVRDGFVSFRLNAGANLRGTFADGADRLVAEIKPGAAAVIRAMLMRGDAVQANGESSVGLVGYFRGQVIQEKTAVTLRPLAEQTYVEYPPPPVRALAVRAPKELQDRYGEGGGALAIVLDCSGSMATPSPSGTGTRFTDVLGALRVLLASVPKGTTVSVIVFGQAVPPDKTVANAEDTIQPLMEPTVWDPTNADLVAGLVSKLEALEPWNESPIVRAMVRARADLVRANGPKTLLVLTDGVDNRFATDRGLNRSGKDVPTFLAEAFRDTGIAVHVVGFQLRGEEERAREQFRVVEKMTPPGRFVTVNDAAALADELRKAASQRLRYWVDREDNELLPDVPPRGLDVSMDKATDQWFVFPDRLPPGGYKVRVDTDRRHSQNVAINRGELLLLNLVPGRQRQDWRRAFVTRDDYPGTAVGERNGWNAALLQNEQTGPNKLQMLLMLEKAPERAEATLRVVRPHDLWIEARPGTSAAQPGLRWGPVGGYAAPAWGLDATNWPAAVDFPGLVKPTVRVWWEPNQDVAPDAVIERDEKLKSLLDAANVKRTVDGGEVVVESVRIETQSVQTGPRTVEPRPCLVVRLRYPKGQPVKVRAEGIAMEGQEQRYYPEVGRCTAVFWPVSEPDARAPEARLALISLNRFKREAEREGNFLTFETPTEPQRNRPRPEPPRLRGNVP